MRIALVCIAKDEDTYLREWLEHHNLIGFDDIWIYENGWRFKDEVPEYVHLIPFDGEIKQLNAYNDFISKHSADYDWALFMDVDEYLCPGKFKDTKAMFSWYKEYLGIGFNWKIFGSSGLEDRDRAFPVLKSFTRSQAGFNKHIKTAINFSKVRESYGSADDVRFINPHFVGIAARSYFTMSASMLRFVCGPYCDLSNVSNLEGMPYIAHYITKSRAEFIERRSKPRADTGSIREDLDQFWKDHDLNEVENLDLMKRIGGHGRNRNDVS